MKKLYENFEKIENFEHNFIKTTEKFWKNFESSAENFKYVLCCVNKLGSFSSKNSEDIQIRPKLLSN